MIKKAIFFCDTKKNFDLDIILCKSCVKIYQNKMKSFFQIK